MKKRLIIVLLCFLFPLTANAGNVMVTDAENVKITQNTFDELADELEKEAEESSAKARKNNSAERNAALEKREQKVNQAEQENKADIETCKKYCNGNCTIKNDTLTCSSNGTKHNLNEVKKDKPEQQFDSDEDFTYEGVTTYAADAERVAKFNHQDFECKKSSSMTVKCEKDKKLAMVYFHHIYDTEEEMRAAENKTSQQSNEEDLFTLDTFGNPQNDKAEEKSEDATHTPGTTEKTQNTDIEQLHEDAQKIVDTYKETKKQIEDKLKASNQ